MKGLQLLKQGMKKGCLNAQLMMAGFLQYGKQGINCDKLHALKLYEGCVHRRRKKKIRRLALWKYANLLRKDGTKLGKFTSQVAADKRVEGLMESSWRQGCAAAGNDIAVDLLVKEKENERAKERERDKQEQKERRRSNLQQGGLTRPRRLMVVPASKREESEEEVKTEQGAENIIEEDDEDDFAENGREEKSSGDAFKLFLETERDGERMALTNAGICFEQGIGVMKIKESAIEYYERAVKMRDALAMNKLGTVCYFYSTRARPLGINRISDIVTW